MREGRDSFLKHMILFDFVVKILNRWESRTRWRRFRSIITEVFWIDKIMIYVYELDRLGLAEQSEPSVEWKVATTEDIDAMYRQGGYDVDKRSRDFFLSFVESDHEYLLLGLQNGTIHTYAVCAVEQKRMNGLFFRLENDEAFISVCFTRAESRGRSWGPRCIREICRRCQVAGKHRVFIDISEANAASIRSAEKAGAVKTDSGYYRNRIWERDHLRPFGRYRDRFIRIAEQ